MSTSKSKPRLDNSWSRKKGKNQSCAFNWGTETPPPFANLLGTSPLHIAAAHGHLQTCKVLLDLPITPDISNKLGKVPLHLAAENGHFDVVELLLSCGATVDAIDLFGMTPLHWACQRGHLQIIILLMHNGANSNILNEFCKTPYALAKEKGFHKSLSILQSAFKSRDPSQSFTSSSLVDQDSFAIDDDGVDGDNDDFDDDVDQLSVAFNAIPKNFRENQDFDTELDDVSDQSRADTDIEVNSPPSGEESDGYQEAVLDYLIEIAENGPQKLHSDPESHAALLRIQAALGGTLDDPSQTFLRAIENGCSFQITEAGTKALSMITPDSWIIPSRRKRSDPEKYEAEEKARGNVAQQKEMDSVMSSALVPFSSPNLDFFSSSAGIDYLEDFSDALTKDTFTPPSPPLKKSKHKF